MLYFRDVHSNHFPTYRFLCSTSLQKRSSHCCHLLTTQMMWGAKGTFSVIVLLRETHAYFGSFYVTSKSKTWQGKKQIARLVQLQFTPTKVTSVAYIIIILKCQRANNGNKLHPANTSCVFYSLLVFAFRHDMELGTKNLPLLFN